MNQAFTAELNDWLFQACVLEVLSPKPGNVSPGLEFGDATVRDFVESARVSAPILAAAGEMGVGRTIFEAVQATQQAVGHNTNLGILLLLAPLAAVPAEASLQDGIPQVLSRLTVDDADWTYRAIRLAEPGGLGDAEDQNVHQSPTVSLQECMKLAAHRDRIAAQYVTDFEDVLETGLAWLVESADVVDDSRRITWLALKLLSRYGDSLIARKCGPEMSERVREHAHTILERGWPQADVGQQAYGQFDEYLRSDGHRLNPGTTADMIAAIIFSGMRSGRYSIAAESMRQVQVWKRQDENV